MDMVMPALYLCQACTGKLQLSLSMLCSALVMPPLCGLAWPAATVKVGASCHGTVAGLIPLLPSTHPGTAA